MISAEQLSDVFVDVADSLVAGFDLVEFLHGLTDHAATVSGGQAVGLLLADQHHQLRYMAATSERAKLLELFQLQTSEGPCLDCYRAREPVVNSDLGRAESRWPLFAPRAIEAGFHSVHAFPMRLRDQVIGALNIFGTADVHFAPSDVKIVQALADVATIAILQERAIAHADVLTEQLQAALTSRIVIEQAKGAIAQLRGVSVDEAFALLRSYARNHQQRLGDVANALLTDPQSVPALSVRTGRSDAKPTPPPAGG